MSKKYRFFFHYYRRFNMMSVHFRGRCFRAREVDCRVPCETKWNQVQPHLVMQGFASKVEVQSTEKIIIS